MSSTTRLSGETSGLATYRRLLAYIKPYRLQFAIAVVGMMVYGATFAAVAAWLEPLLDAGFVERSPDSIWFLPLSIVVIFFFRGLGSFLSIYYMAYIGGHVVNKLRSEVFSKYLHLPSKRYDRSSSGEMISLVSYNVQQVSSAASDAITVIIRDTFAIIGLIGLMFWHSWQLAASLIILGPVVATIVFYVSKRFRRISRTIQSSMGK
ncbi:MAG: ABC transporter transmembrane domain-containing protein, partial [Pseudomonadota bacterium]